MCLWRQPFCFPSYGSPLLPAGGFDSAYVGVVLIEKPDEETRICCPEWEDIDLETLGEQTVWATKNEQISGGPSSFFFHKNNGPTEPKNRSKKSTSIRKESKEKVTLYIDHYKHGDSSCDFHLVVTHSGWFVSLCQLFCKRCGARRERDDYALQF